MLIAIDSQIGLVRETNQDAVFTDYETLFSVADGMGGLEDGERAALAVVSQVKNNADKLRSCATGDDDESKVLEVLKSTIRNADKEVVRQTKVSRRVSGSTAVVWLFRGNRVCFSWVGDSSLFLVTSDKIVKLTRDHTVAQEKVDNGMGHIVMPRDEHTLTRCVGAGLDEGPEAGDIELSGEVPWGLLGCTDGYNLLDPDEMREHFVNSNGVEDWLEIMKSEILSRGASDNFSAVAIRQNVGVPE